MHHQSAMARPLWLLTIALIAAASHAYYVPGTYPQEFAAGTVLQAQVNSLTSFETELPFEYYTMPFCKPPEGIKKMSTTANLGTILMGLRIENSPYNFTMMKKELGKLACKDGAHAALTKEETENLKHKINNHYRINMLLDNLPVTVYDLMDEDQEFVRPGFELGYIDEKGRYYINNHLVFNILVHMTHGEYTRARQAYKDAITEALDTKRRMALLSVNSRKLAEEAGTAAEGDTVYMVVGFEVSPCSIERKAGADIENVACGMDNSKHLAQEITEGVQIVYTYDVYWSISKTRWASRWDAYLRMPGGKVHWFSILNSILIVLVMASLVAMILIRTVRRDLARYEQLVVDGNNMDMKDEAGWKLVSGDVFRAPSNSRHLVVHLGSGVQIIATAVVTLMLAALGFLSPASRGALLTTTMVFYVLLAVVAGYSAVYLWGMIERTYNGWIGVCASVALFFPGITMAIFTLLNLVIHHTGSTGAVPIGMYFSIVAVWFLVSVPLTFAGGYLATKAEILNYPVKTNQIPRHIPPPPFVANPILLYFASGILPFGTMFIELYFAMTSLWMGYFYYLFGFVFMIGILTVIINAEIAVLCTYVQLCSEDYLWWWRSFYRGGSVAFYISIYAVGFLASNLHTLAGAMPVFIYLCYMSILILGFFFAMGTIGCAASFWFVYKIFAAVKQD